MTTNRKINTYDIDGVIYLGPDYEGLTPGHKHDAIVTGRSVDERAATEQMLAERGIENVVFYNPTPFHEKTRESSAHWKVDAIKTIDEKFGHGVHFEDDPVQAVIIRNAGIRVIEVNSAGYVPLENVWHEVKKA
jgi:hypothetical protein